MRLKKIKTMKVKELIKELQNQDQEATAMIWGTDGNAGYEQLELCNGKCEDYWFIAPVCNISTSCPDNIIEQCKDEKSIVFLEVQ